MRDYDYLIVGAGLAAASAVEGIRQCDEEGSILMLGEESEPPYNRPPLSKEYLQAPEIPRELLHVKPEGWYEDAGVTLLRERRVLSLDPAERTVISARGNDYRGERILLATGGRAREIAVPGSDLAGVHSLRGVEDAEEVRTAAPVAQYAVLVGAGFIGMELAASLRGHGVETVVVEQLERVWPRLLPPGLATEVQGYFERRGVGFQLGQGVAGFRGDSALEAVELADGSLLPCDLAVVGVGIAPNQELAQAAGLAVQDGILVDAFGETSHAFIYAAGDVARFPDPLSGDLTRVEHWDHARAHGRSVGANMAGAKAEYGHISYFFSDVFDLGINAVGHLAGADEVMVSGSIDGGRLIAAGLASGTLCGVLLVNAAEEMEAARELVRRCPEGSRLREAFGAGQVDLGALFQ